MHFSIRSRLGGGYVCSQGVLRAASMRQQAMVGRTEGVAAPALIMSVPFFS